MTISTILTELAEQHPDRLAIAFEGTTEVTFAELDEMVTQFANGLVHVGLEPGDRVVIMMKNRPQYLVAVFGIARAAMVMVPVNRRASATEIGNIIRDAGARYVITEPGFEAIVDDALTLPSMVGVAVALADAPANDGRVITLDELLELGRTPATLAVAQDSDVGAIHYTSGTTSTARGVVRTHAANLAVARAAIEAVPTNAGEAWLATLPMNSVGIHAFVIGPMIVGATAVISADVEPELILTLAQRYRVVELHAVPTVWEMMMRADKVRGNQSQALPDLRAALWGGSPMPRGTAERLDDWLPTPCLGCYGSTEAPCMSYSTVDIYRSGRFNSSGPAVSGMEMRIVDEAGSTLPVGEWGEVQIRGSLMMNEYLNKPELTQAAFTADRWFITGDWGMVSEDGALTVTDRKKDMVITGGENVYPGEVESTISRMPGIAEVAVVGVPDDLWGQTLWAFVISDSDSVTPEAIESYCRQSLAAYKTPRRIEFVDELPKNALGKFLKPQIVSQAVELMEAEV